MRAYRTIFRPCVTMLLCVLVAGVFGLVTHAKRGPKPIVPPLQADGIEFRAPNNPDTEGIIEAWDPKSNTLLWSKRVYRTLKDPLAEQDVQWNFIKSMSLSSDRTELVIVDERGRTHVIGIAPPGVRSHVFKPVLIFLIVLVGAATIAAARKHRHRPTTSEPR